MDWSGVHWSCRYTKSIDMTDVLSAVLSCRLIYCSLFWLPGVCVKFVLSGVLNVGSVSCDVLLTTYPGKWLQKLNRSQVEFALTQLLTGLGLKSTVPPEFLVYFGRPSKVSDCGVLTTVVSDSSFCTYPLLTLLLKRVCPLYSSRPCLMYTVTFEDPQGSCGGSHTLVLSSVCQPTQLFG